MELVSARIEGFRNIESIKIVFGDITSLVSVNNYGKSNFMRAIEFAVEFIRAERSRKDAMMSWVQGIPFNKYLDSKNFVVDFVFSVTLNGRAYFVNYGYEFVWIKNNSTGKEIIKEWLALKEDEKSQKYNKLINRDGNCLYKTSVTGRCSNILKVEKNELMVNKLLLNDSLFYYDLIKKLNEMNVYLESHLDTFGWYSENPNEFALNDIANIPQIIYYMKEHRKEKYDMLQNAFFQLFPNITDIDVREIDLGKTYGASSSKNVPYMAPDKIYSMHVQDINMNQPLKFESLSDGAKRVFLMMTGIVLADIVGITLIALEEPENSIHPSLLQGYLDVISQLAGNCKIVIASHSPYIMQYVNTGDIYIGKPNRKGIADFARFDSHRINQLLKDASENGDSVGNYIFELLSGGEDDMDILLDYLEK